MVAVGNGAGLAITAGLPPGTRLGGTIEGESLGDHLKVDVALIRTTAQRLGAIKDALQHPDASKPGREVLGSDDLSRAMDEFVGNWEVHRDKLVSALEAHQQMAAASADAYEHTDSELATALTQHSSPDGARVAS
jgi:hypothetical protein